MADTSTKHYLGRKVVFEVALTGSETTKPAGGDWGFFGACNTKSFKMDADTVDGTTDRTTGGVRANFATYGSYEISLDGKVRANDKSDEKHTLAVQARNAALSAGNQPTLWTRATFPNGRQITAYCIFSAYSMDAPDADLTSFSATFMATESDFGVEDVTV